MKIKYIYISALVLVIVNTVLLLTNKQSSLLNTVVNFGMIALIANDLKRSDDNGKNK